MASLFFLTKFALIATAAVKSVNAVPTTEARSSLEKRTTILAYDDIVGFTQTVPDTTEGDLYTAYQPHLYVYNGCVPFPAVDAEGDVSGGLPITGLDGNTDCTSSTGQIYARAAAYEGYYAIMYAWFMPKDEPSYDLGHVYDWEGVVVFLTSSTSTTAGNIVSICPSRHGDWSCTSSDLSDYLSGTSSLIEYISYEPVDHTCYVTTTVGGKQPMIAYESLPTAALDTLETYDFGSAIVPFVDATFTSNLALAYASFTG